MELPSHTLSQDGARADAVIGRKRRAHGSSLASLLQLFSPPCPSHTAAITAHCTGQVVHLLDVGAEVSSIVVQNSVGCTMGFFGGYRYSDFSACVHRPMRVRQFYPVSLSRQTT